VMVRLFSGRARYRGRVRPIFDRTICSVLEQQHVLPLLKHFRRTFITGVDLVQSGFQTPSRECVDDNVTNQLLIARLRSSACIPVQAVPVADELRSVVMTPVMIPSLRTERLRGVCGSRALCPKLIYRKTRRTPNCRTNMTLLVVTGAHTNSLLNAILSTHHPYCRLAWMKVTSPISAASSISALLNRIECRE
jgi:hypothetical protein